MSDENTPTPVDQVETLNSEFTTIPLGTALGAYQRADPVESADLFEGLYEHQINTTLKDHIAKADLRDSFPEDSVGPNTREVEDDFTTLLNPLVSRNPLIEPPYNLARLEELTHQNSALAPCIDAMEVNVPGTGWNLEPVEQSGTPSDEQKKRMADISEFFKEPWPGQSFTTIRRLLRRDLEAMGNAYLEIIRNALDEVVFAKYVDAKTIRMVRLGEAVKVVKKVKRKGKEIDLVLRKRERKFVQMVGGGIVRSRQADTAFGTTGFRSEGKESGTVAGLDVSQSAASRLVFFKEFGADRDINMLTGDWAEEDVRLPFNARGSELIQLRMHKDARTPYGLPRWLAQTPSVLGTRRAEEYNLQFFNQGGVPPLMVIVSGGQLAKNAREALARLLAPNGQAKHSAAILEAYATGSLDGKNNVRVTVERFGADRQKDSMFETYIRNGEERIRASFRMPPAFLGLAGEYNFATAKTSYMVAEAQLFGPERMEEDEIWNSTLMSELNPEKEFKFRSKPLIIKDVQTELKAVEVAIANNLTNREDALLQINETADTHLRVADGTDPINPEENERNSVFDPGQPQSQNTVQVVGIEKAEFTGIGSLAFALSQTMATGLRKEEDVNEFMSLMRLVGTMKDAEVNDLRHALAIATLEDAEIDLAGSSDLIGCAAAVLAGRQNA